MKQTSRKQWVPVLAALLLLAAESVPARGSWSISVETPGVAVVPSPPVFYGPVGGYAIPAPVYPAPPPRYELVPLMPYSPGPMLIRINPVENYDRDDCDDE